MNEIILNMLARRSIRKYRPNQIPADLLQTILEAGQYAPSAGGRQSCVIAVCQDAKMNAALGAVNKGSFHGRISTLEVYISKDQPSIADDPTLPSAFYSAPTVLTLFAPKRFIYSEIDCAVTAQNIMLAAHALGIGSCMVGRAEEAFLCESGKKLLTDWGIEENLSPKIHIVLGYAASTQVRPSRAGREGSLRSRDAGGNSLASCAEKGYGAATPWKKVPEWHPPSPVSASSGHPGARFPKLTGNGCYATIDLPQIWNEK